MPRRTPQLAASGKALADALERVHDRDRLRARVGAALAALHVHMRQAAELRGSARGTQARSVAHADQLEVKELRERMAALGDVDAALWKAYDDKETALADASPRAKQALRLVAAAIGGAGAEIGALKDVSEVARRARAAVRNVREQISAAAGSRNSAVENQYATAVAFSHVADACTARLERALDSVPSVAAGAPPTYAQQRGFMWTPLVNGTKAVDRWLERLFARIQKRRRALQAKVRELEARRSRWVLRA